MLGYKHVALNSETAYVYDGGLPGLYCAVHESVYAKEMPISITPIQLAQPALFETKMIYTEQRRAARVRNSIRDKISPRALELVETAYYTCLKEKELCILRFLLLGYEQGAAVTRMLGHPLVSPLLGAEKHLWGEQHLLLGFVRFSDYDGMLAATITPKNFVLPFMASHFVNRFSCENFLIYDKTHNAALIYNDRKCEIKELHDLQLNAPTEKEEMFRALWKQFYHTIAIEARYNPKCRMTHMPKRYWENMTEMQELL